MLQLAGLMSIRPASNLPGLCWVERLPENFRSRPREVDEAVRGAMTLRQITSTVAMYRQARDLRIYFVQIKVA